MGGNFETIQCCMLLVLSIIVYCARRTLFPEEALLQIDQTYSKLVDTLVEFELFLCRMLKFQLSTDNPHKVRYMPASQHHAVVVQSS